MRGSIWLVALRFVGCFVLAMLYVASLAVGTSGGTATPELLVLMAVIAAGMLLFSDETFALPIQILTVSYLAFFVDTGGNAHRIGQGIWLVLTFALTLCGPVLAGWYVFGRRRGKRIW